MISGLKKRIGIVLNRNLDDFKLHQAVELLNAHFNINFDPANKKALDKYLTEKMSRMGYSVKYLLKQPQIKPPKVKNKKLPHNRRKKVKIDDFYNSYEWTKLRYQILKKYGAACMCCGATREDGIRMNVDHIKPRKTHPHLALDENNLQVLCATCNKGKCNWDSTDWRPI